MRLEVLPVEGIGDVRPGDDLAAAITTAAPWLRAGDVLVVTSKIVSKAEGSLVDVPVDGDERAVARDEVLRAETARPVARRGQTRIVQTHHGFVMASAGIDASNVDRAHLVLLPKDPDASARALRTTLRERHGLDVAVVISDTMGRPWRNGLTDVALGAAGISAIRDHRGEVDPYGNELSITQMAVVDELAAAGELVKGKCAQVPVAVVRGYLDTPLPEADGDGAAVLVRGADQDLFSLGTAEARAEGLRAAARLPDHGRPPFPVLDELDFEKALTRALATISAESTATFAADLLPGDDSGRCRVVCRPADSGGVALVSLGADVQRLRAALAADGLGSTMETAEDGRGTHVVVTVS
ncbi:coenzyme F420-0:L-glutamate ligase / coenzyme F420-1:gamma-L-glutamate ligase [Asanoa hainanensis]|uniref:Coenzyme F420-0:L-glutamate ligase / coenzyme F420-1:gamma-L-glutamate ligase n=1 Tax=Asanoa hainanensis TaxID=560556 RepID=A0A239ICG4_9ACTN|nr:coenzyme F420-0:L-glutamate ligase [Asanoa hainanensis]SNS91235.1 coenzyme F420-0:L-glutamate ligase / coenzyme F420-1:gamma-L-glutamate ligase [Asanoa hainanensis]